MKCETSSQDEISVEPMSESEQEISQSARVPPTRGRQTRARPASKPRAPRRKSENAKSRRKPPRVEPAESSGGSEPGSNANSEPSDSETATQQNGSVPEDFEDPPAFERFRAFFPPDPVLPQEWLGDLLEIYSFFRHFDSALDAPDFELEELHEALRYSGPEYLDFVHDLHSIIVGLFVKNLDPGLAELEPLTRPRPAQLSAPSADPEALNPPAPPLLAAVTVAQFKEKIKVAAIRAAWPQLASEYLIAIYTPDIPDNLKRVIDILNTLAVYDYTALSYSDKISILLALINACSGLKEIKEVHTKIHEKVIGLTKEKVDLAEKAKNQRKNFRDLQDKIRLLHEKITQLEGSAPSEPNSDSKRTELSTSQKQLAKFEKDLERVGAALKKLELKLLDTKRSLQLCVHCGDFLGRDRMGNSYWVFEFSPESVFSASRDNRLWVRASKSAGFLANSLDTKDKVLGTLKAKLAVFAREGNDAEPENLKSEEIIRELEEYRSLYDQKKEGKKSKDADSKYTELIEKMSGVRGFQLPGPDFVKQILAMTERKFSEYLSLHRMEWIEKGEKNAAFFSALEKLSSPKDLNLFIADLEKSFCCVDSLASDDESSPSEDGRHSEASEIDFRRNARKIANEPTQKAIVRVKKSLKLWSYNFQNLKVIFREMVQGHKTASSSFISAVILYVTVVRFISLNKEKEEKKAKELETLRKKIERKAIEKNEQTENNERGESRRNRRVGPSRCERCATQIGKEDPLVCIACEKKYHKACKELEEGVELDKWRCDECLEMMEKLRFTRRLRKQLKL